MKKQKMINLIAAAGLILGPVGAVASPGWAFDNPNVPADERGAGSGEKHTRGYKDSSGAGWAFNNPNVPEVKKSSAATNNHAHKYNEASGPGWAFNNPNVSRLDRESGHDPS